MTHLILEQFGGVAPKIDPRKLAPGLAQIADECLFERTNLRSLRNPLSVGVTLAADTKVVFPYDGGWLQFDEYVSVAEGPVANDTHDRIYITDSDFPKVRSGTDIYRLGIPRPIGQPYVTPPTEPVVDDPDSLLEVEDIYYVVTLVDAFGAEGPPSLPSNMRTRYRNDPVTVTMPDIPVGNYNFGPGAVWRLYRSNTGTEETNFQFVADIGIATTVYEDEVLNDELQEVVPSGTWTGPPDDNTALWPWGPLQGLCLGPNGMMAGFVGRSVYLCEPYLPHAWPLDYRTTIRDNILGIVWISAGLLVVTDGQPVIIIGSYPPSMTVFYPERGWPCTDGRSLVDMGGWAIYNSSDGLVGVDGQTFTLLTQPLADNNAWVANVSHNAVCGNSEGRYVMNLLYSPGVTAGMIFDPADGINALTRTALYSDVVYHGEDDNILYVRDANDELAKFDWGTDRTFTWKSKIFALPTDTNFAYLEVVANAYPVHIELYAGRDWDDHTLVYEVDVAERFSPLPSGFEFDQWTVQIEDDKEVVMVGLYEDLTEVG